VGSSHCNPLLCAAAIVVWIPVASRRFIRDEVQTFVCVFSSCVERALLDA
jgi:hypothetical protein